MRVASVPAAHVYVRHLSPVEGGTHVGPAVHRLPDRSTREDPPTGAPWWPPRMLEATWVREHAEAFDLMHLQFGFDARSPDQLRDLVEALHEHGKPLLYTVHDLRNPHQADRAQHDACLDVLVPAADALVTLTPGAAREIEQRWGRIATVLPHPHVVELPEIRRRQAAPPVCPREFRVGLHVKSLRASMDPHAVLPVLVHAVEQVPGGVLQVDGHRDVLDPDGARHDPHLLAALLAAGPSVDLRVHDYFSDDELVDYLASLDVSVLPYRFGTHSGWLEACRDLGTAVVAPTCGYYAEQGPVQSYVMDQERLDEDSLVQAVLRAHRAGPVPPVPVEERRVQREQLASAHARLYSELLEG